ncbi:Bax inhibitor 1 [Datura stramonium]|uniref:Bax inhibitor 1 n=1 Tax=Datura stramonium TaxID=4076 RepID=A0ABS8RHA2_DATST|nr:Bax inhibitor 1 [Datura stramonium]
MKLQAMNAVKAYFKRSWRKADMMNFGVIPQHAYTSLKRVYLTLFCAMLSFTFGSFLHFIWEVGGKFTVLSSVACLRRLYFTSPWRVRTRVILLMYAAYSFGASFGLLTKYLFEAEQGKHSSLALQPCCQPFGSLLVNALDILDSHTAHCMLTVYTLLVLFMGYLVLYSQEILYDARYGDVNYVNCTFTVFFCLPAIVVHAARLYLGAEIQQHRQNQS